MKDVEIIKARNVDVYKRQDENRDKEVRRPRASIRRQLSETKQAQAPKKAPARTKKNELEV